MKQQDVVELQESDEVQGNQGVQAEEVKVKMAKKEMADTTTIEENEDLSKVNSAANQTSKARAHGQTGPKSLAGKNRSRWNALKDGSTAKSTVLPFEDEQLYQKHIREVEKALAPVNYVEAQMVREYAEGLWRIIRHEKRGSYEREHILNSITPKMIADMFSHPRTIFAKKEIVSLAIKLMLSNFEIQQLISLMPEIAIKWALITSRRLSNEILTDQDSVNQILEQIVTKFSHLAYIRVTGVPWEVVVKLDSIANNLNTEPGDQAIRIIKFEFNMTAQTYIPQPIERKKAVLKMKVDFVDGLSEDEITEVMARIEESVKELEC